MCIWLTPIKNRHCEFCTYGGPCERIVVKKRASIESSIAIMSEIVGEDIRTRSRDGNSVWARYIVCYFLKNQGYSSTEIAKALNRDHSTVLYGISRIKYMLQMKGMYCAEMIIFNKFEEKMKYYEKID